MASASHKDVASMIGLANHSERAIQRNMKDHGVGTYRAKQRKKLLPETKTKREIWAFERRYWKLRHFYKYRYSDESHFALKLQRQAPVHRRRGTKYRNMSTKCQDKYKRENQCLHVFGLIGWNWKGPLHFYEGSGKGGRMIKADYVKILEEVVKPIWKDDWILFEDNDNSHGTRGDKENEVKQAKKRLQIKTEANISTSPDFNAIERIWRIIKQRLKNRGLFFEKRDLKRAIEEEWRKLTLDEINREIEKSLKVVQEVMMNGGEMTSF